MPFQPGHKLSKGRPKQSLETHLGLNKKLTSDEFNSMATKLLCLNPEELLSNTNNPKTSSLEAWMGAIIIEGMEKRCEEKLDFFLNRLLGRLPTIQINQQNNYDQSQETKQLQLAQAEEGLKTVMDQAIKDRENMRMDEVCLEAGKSTTGQS